MLPQVVRIFHTPKSQLLVVEKDLPMILTIPIKHPLHIISPR
jgi:hypothetical protein